MGIPGHILTAAAATGIAFSVTHSVSFGLGVAVGSLLLDGDHILDYLFIDHQRSANPIRFVMYYSRSFPLRRVLLLHSYELLFILAGFALLIGSRAIAGFAAGAFIHLVADFLPPGDRSFRSRLRFYSFIYRWHHGFNSNHLYRLD